MHGLRITLRQMLPFLEWLPELKHWPVLRSDLIAGLTVAMLFIPQSMAYAHLANLPVYVGLYAAFIPPIVAALFGSSRFLSTGPVPVTSLLTAVALIPMAVSGTSEQLQYLVLLTLMAGIIQLTLGTLRFGIVVNFLSYPVILGFINAIALIIASMQLSSLFGVSAVTAPHYYQTVWQVLRDALVSTHWPSVGMATIAFIIILAGRRLWPRLPHILIAVVITSVIAWLCGYEKTETIYPGKIINLPVQQMLDSYQHYPQEMEQLLRDVNKANDSVQTVLKEVGKNTEQADEAINQASQAKWQLERRVLRHNFETSELSRLRLRRLVAKNKQVVFFVDQQMTPIGQVGSQQWRIVNFPIDGGQLTLHAGGEIVGNIPQGLPTFKPVVWDWDAISRLFMPALVIALVGFTEAITIAKRIATKSRQRLNINQELLSQGLAKCVGSFFQSMPVSGGFTRSAINFGAGAKTGFSSVVAGLAVMMVLLWFTPLFYYLPYATLAAVIIVGVLGLIDIKEIRRVWQVSRNEGIVSLLTFLLTLLLAPHLAHAVILGMLLSLGVYLYETMRPRFSELVRNEDGSWLEIGEDAHYETCDQISLVRFGGSLYFANVSYFEEKILQLITTKKQLHYIVLDCVGINKLDASGLETLYNLCKRLEDVGIQLWLTRVREPVFEVLKRGGLFDYLGEGRFYKSNEQALDKIMASLGKKHTHTCHLIT